MGLKMMMADIYNVLTWKRISHPGHISPGGGQLHMQLRLLRPH